jgi:hypothetical protein
MQNVIILILAVFFVYLLFFRRGGMGSGMGMGCCGGHASHGDHSSHVRDDCHGGHGAESDKDWHPDEISADRKEDVIDLREDQYSVQTVEEGREPKAMDRKAS